MVLTYITYKLTEVVKKVARGQHAASTNSKKFKLVKGHISLDRSLDSFHLLST